MSEEMTPALAASHASWKAVQSHDKEGWLGLMHDDVVIEDPIGKAITNPDGTGVRGKEAVEAFYDTNIGPNNLRIECEETFPSSSPLEVAHILTLSSAFDNGITSTVRGVFSYRVDDEGKILNLRGWWNMDRMIFGNADDADGEGNDA